MWISRRKAEKIAWIKALFCLQCHCQSLSAATVILNGNDDDNNNSDVNGGVGF